MPEGPSIVIMKEAFQPFKEKKVVSVSGNSKEDIARMEGRKIIDFKSWGKHTIIQFKDFFVRIHLLMFGSYRINEEKENATPRLSLHFAKGFINFYTCSVRITEGNPDDVYDYSADVMSDSWDERKALKKLKQHPDMLLCDALLNQDIFSGVGNIIKNEVLFRIRLHPASTVGATPLKKLKEMIKEARNYSFDFLEWKKAYVLKKHWLIHTKRECPRCHIPAVKEYLGKTN